MKPVAPVAIESEPAPGTVGADGEQSRARYPDAEGFVERDGMKLFYEVYGEGEETLFLLPTWSLIHSRHWKMQIPYFARHFPRPRSRPCRRSPKGGARCASWRGASSARCW